MWHISLQNTDLLCRIGEHIPLLLVACSWCSNFYVSLEFLHNYYSKIYYNRSVWLYVILMNTSTLFSCSACLGFSYFCSWLVSGCRPYHTWSSSHGPTVPGWNLLWIHTMFHIAKPRHGHWQSGKKKYSNEWMSKNHKSACTCPMFECFFQLKRTCMYWSRHHSLKQLS